MGDYYGQDDVNNDAKYTVEREREREGGGGGGGADRQSETETDIYTYMWSETSHLVFWAS